MARIVTDQNGETHLRNSQFFSERTLCQDLIQEGSVVTEGDLTCSECAQIALEAIELTTKKERRSWRDL